MDLYWESEDDGDCLTLFAGVNDTELAVLRKRRKWWEAIIWIPGVHAAKPYAPLEILQPEIEQKVRDWFALASTHRPAMDREEAPEG